MPFPFFPKGGSKVEVKNSPPPLEMPLYIILFSDLVEVEVKFKKKFKNDNVLLTISRVKSKRVMPFD